ncbi:hypothetical protein MAPG_07171, partial [Magnaporthiopsis poae ATCC 64411]
MAATAGTATATTPLRVDPEWAKVWEQIGSTPKPNFTNVWEVREAGNAMVGAIMARLPRHDGMLESKHRITSLDGTVLD